MLKLMYITNNLNVALMAQKYGVDRVWIDLETLGKEERQKNLDSVKSNHTVSDVKRIAPLMHGSELLVRVNPWNDNSVNEINEVIDAGAQLVMLPMWKSVYEVKNFIGSVAGRAKTVLLLETREAEECLDEVLQLDGIDEIHIGLNDLHLSYGLTFMFQLLANGTVERICNAIRKKGIPYGFGGVAQIGEGLLSAENVILEHYRLGSTRAILSRSFCNAKNFSDMEKLDAEFRKNMKALRDFEKKAACADYEELSDNKEFVRRRVDEIVENLRK